ncbi:DUF885 domain-containing protein [Undibacterium fentianense]|uniref:DUF885 domain-containing protein n=1 Tax=Undibacterium fentianense TaxID=2828728 RepID=A0A941DZC9_9BURK|nr:DUF885 domain-containing protein [Undibacterium fentianense]MBR7799550.1 DUF885 domain-containing protein [Undibacterium fentianense]
MSIKKVVQLSSLTFALVSGAIIFAPDVYATQTRATQDNASQAKKKLDQLAEAFYESRTQFDPLLFATINGDNRYDNQLGISINPQQRARQFALMHKMQAQIKTIKRDQLGEKDQLNYDLLAYEIDSALHFEHFPEHLLPLNQMDNVPSTLANFASGDGSQALTTVPQYYAYLARLNKLNLWIDQAIKNMREGIRLGIVQPKAITLAMLPQFKTLPNANPEASIFYTPIKNLPASFSAADKQKLSQLYIQVISAKLTPSLQRLVHFLETDYLKAGRETSGYGALPNGAAWYQMRIKDHTTTDLTPDQIHNLGLQEVARIQEKWAELGPKLGYTGPAIDLPQWVSTQEKFKSFNSDTEILDAYREIDKKVQAKLPSLFSLLPKGKLELQLEPELSRATASDHYTPPSADGSHPGVFWPVVNDPKKYSRIGMVTLFLHEGQPGHHLHAALLKEIKLPKYRKFNTENLNSAAFTEGWALYSETLGHELGFYDNPESYFGHLNDELMRAVRLVVDTGLHAKTWTREEAIQYMQKNLGYNEAHAKNQIERYMVLPGQALSYKIGARKILELRARAEKALGSQFSLAKFHEIVIGDGTLPMPILESQVDKWIAKGK